jgi:polar amino acid transport system permease protein
MSTTAQSTRMTGNEDLRASVKPYFPVGRVAAAALLVIVLAFVVYSLWTNPKLDWPVVGEFLFSSAILVGLLQTLALALSAYVLSLIVGTIVGLGRISKNPVVRVVSFAYVWIFRGVPALIQVLVWGNISLFIPSLTLGIPGTDIVWFSVPTNDVVTSFAAALCALTLINGAYLAEVVRAGIMSVDEGQRDASAALAMSWWNTQRYVVLPQAVRIIVPPAGSRFITLLKETALVSVIAGGNILTAANNIAAGNYRIIELLLVASIWFLLVTSVASFIQSRIERRLARSR